MLKGGNKMGCGNFGWQSNSEKQSFNNCCCQKQERPKQEFCCYCCCKENKQHQENKNYCGCSCCNH